MNTALIRHFVHQDLVGRHAGSALGALWTLLLPLANILIFTLVFSRIMGARLNTMGIDYLGAYSYSVYLITGLLAWNVFASTLLRITAVFDEKAGLITKVNVSLIPLPLYIAISEMVVYAISMVFFAVFLLIIDFHWTYQWLWLPVIFIIQQIFAYGLGLLLATISVFFSDIRNLVGIGVQLWFWLTPVVYVISILPEKWAFLFQVNPLYHTVTAFRDSLITGSAPNWQGLGYVLVVGLILFTLAVALCKHLEKDIRDFL